METCGKGDPCITHSLTLIGIREMEQGIAQFVGVGVDQKAIDPIFHGMDCPSRSPGDHRFATGCGLKEDNSAAFH